MLHAWCLAAALAPAPPASAAPPAEIPTETAPDPAPEAAAAEPAPAPVPAPVPATPAPAPATAAPAPAPSRFVPPREPEKMKEGPIGDNARFKPGMGVEVTSKDKRFSLQFNAFVQIQAPIVRTPAQPGGFGVPETPAQTTMTLWFRRARLVFGGNLFSPNIKYKIQLTASPAELQFKSGVPTRTPILDWYFTFDRFRDATLQVGQYKVAYNHQRMLRVSGMQFVDRSSANNEFTMDRDIGLDLRSKDAGGLGKLRYYLGVFLGDGIARYGASDFGLMYTGRLEVLPFGQFDDLEEADHERSMKPRLLIGAAYAFIDRDPHDNHGFFGAIPLDGGKTTTHNATADLSFKLAGFSLESAFFFRKGKRLAGDAVDPNGMPYPTIAPRNGLGYFVQAGYLIPRIPLEFGARWGQIRGLGTTSLRDQSELGGVVGYYFYRHSLKLQLDYLRLWNEEIRLGTDQIRLQLQAMF